MIAGTVLDRTPSSRQIYARCSIEGDNLRLTEKVLVRPNQEIRRRVERREV